MDFTPVVANLAKARQANLAKFFKELDFIVGVLENSVVVIVN
jgi:hypothetical protein